MMVRRGAMAREEKGRQSVKSGPSPFFTREGARDVAHHTHHPCITTEAVCVVVSVFTGGNAALTII